LFHKCHCFGIEKENFYFYYSTWVVVGIGGEVCSIAEGLFCRPIEIQNDGRSVGRLRLFCNVFRALFAATSHKESEAEPTLRMCLNCSTSGTFKVLVVIILFRF
jgi:hypothetical protein